MARLDINRADHRKHLRDAAEPIGRGLTGPIALTPSAVAAGRDPGTAPASYSDNRGHNRAERRKLKKMRGK